MVNIPYLGAFILDLKFWLPPLLEILLFSPLVLLVGMAFIVYIIGLVKKLA